MTTFRVEFRSRHGILLHAVLVDAVTREQAEQEAREIAPVRDSAIATAIPMPSQVAA